MASRCRPPDGLGQQNSGQTPAASAQPGKNLVLIAAGKKFPGNNVFGKLLLQRRRRPVSRLRRHEARRLPQRHKPGSQQAFPGHFLLRPGPFPRRKGFQLPQRRARRGILPRKGRDASLVAPDTTETNKPAYGHTVPLSRLTDYANVSTQASRSQGSAPSRHTCNGTKALPFHSPKQCTAPPSERACRAQASGSEHDTAKGRRRPSASRTCGTPVSSQCSRTSARVSGQRHSHGLAFTMSCTRCTARAVSGSGGLSASGAGAKLSAGSARCRTVPG